MKNRSFLSLSLIFFLFLNSAGARFSSDDDFEKIKSSNLNESMFHGHNIATGIHLRPSSDYGERLARFNSEIQKPAAILMYFLDWSGHPFQNQVFDYYLVQQIRNKISSDQLPVIMLTWQPIIYGERDQELGNCYPNSNGVISPLDIVAGKCDQYIRMFAEDLSERPERYLLRFAHEMNISDSPWWPGHFNLGPDIYVKMWRHVYSIFSHRQKELGKNNVEWVWSINYASYPQEPWNAYYYYYPGDEFVDWIGLSGYNWNTSKFPFATFTNIYGEVDGSDALILPGILHDLACRYAKPQIIAEVGTNGNPEQNAQWISDAFNAMPSYPFLRGVVWFNDFAYANPREADFRVLNLDPNYSNVDIRITQAYRAGVQKPFYSNKLDSLDKATPPTVYCGGGEPIYLYPSMLILEPGETVVVQFAALAILEDTDVVFVDVPQAVQILVQPNPISSPWGITTANLSVSLDSHGTYSVKFKFGENGIEHKITVLVVQDKSQVFLPTVLR